MFFSINIIVDSLFIIKLQLHATKINNNFTIPPNTSHLGLPQSTI